MEIRKLEKSENNSTRFLYEEIFLEDSKNFVDYYYTEKTKDNQIYVVEEDGEIRAMLHLNPYELMVNGTKKDANYIVAVATQKEYRRRGYMAELLKRSLRDMYKEGQTFTFLMPAAESIYLPHDFRTVYEQDRRYYNEERNMIGEICDSEVSVSVATEEDCESLAEWANAVLFEHFQVYAKRSKDYYERLIKEYQSDSGKLMIVRKGGEIADCLISVSEEEHEKPKMMVRIVDVRRMLMAMKVKSLMAVCFQIIDPIIEENNRVVVITGTEYSGLMLMDSKPENSEGIMTVAALTSLLFGAKTVDEVYKEDGVTMSERMKGEMEKIIPLSKIYLNEVV